MPLSVYPSGSYGAGNVLIYPHTFYRNNTWHYAGGTGTASFLPYKPTGSSARMVLLYIDDNDAPAYVAGSFFNSTYTGTVQVFPYIPSLPVTSGIPLAGIRLVSGTSVILWDNIYDLRPWIVGDSFIPTGSYGHTIADEGVSLPNQPVLDFIGPGVGVRNTAGRTEVIVSGTSSGATATTGCRVRISGSFNLASADYFIPQWWEVVDDNNYFNPATSTQIQIPETGWYSINARFQIYMASAVTGTSQFTIQIVDNGADWNEYTFLSIPPTPLGVTLSSNLFVQRKYTAGEYIEIEIQQDTGNDDVRVNGGSGYESELTIVKI